MTETQLNGTPPPSEPADATTQPKASSAKPLVVFAVVVLGALVAAGVTYLFVRNLWRRKPADETTERIQSLIDEANRLIRTLEEKK